MAHKTKIGGTAYNVVGGKTKVSGTAYNIIEGKTKINGTAMTIPFGHLWKKYTVNTTTTERTSTDNLGADTGYWSLTDLDMRASEDGMVRSWTYGSLSISGNRLTFSSGDYWDVDGVKGRKRYGLGWNTRGSTDDSSVTKQKSVFTDSNHYWSECTFPSDLHVDHEIEHTPYIYYAPSVTVTRHWYTTSESKGSYIGTVQSQDANAYPDNGKHTDGYWYVKII